MACVTGLDMVNVCCDTIGLCIEYDAGSMTPHNAMRLFFLWMTLNVWDSDLDMIDHVASTLPMDCQYITPLFSGLGFMVVVEEAFRFSDFWFHWTCRISNGIRQGKSFLWKVLCKTINHIILLVLVLPICSRRFRRSGVEKRNSIILQQLIKNKLG